MTVSVNVGAMTLIAQCPSGDAALASGATFFCTSEVFSIHVPNLDLTRTNTIVVTVTMNTGQVLAKDVVIDLGPVVDENSDEMPGACSRSTRMTLM